MRTRTTKASAGSWQVRTTGYRRCRSAPGTLNVFKGKNTAHRVSPVEGDRPRIIAVFSYYETPDVCFSDAERLGFYGRKGSNRMIEKRRFGRTGHMSTATIFGAAALKNVSQGEADRALELLLEHGVNHIDTAPRYGDAELRIGPWMRAHRDDFFLATKTGQRTYEAARDEIRRSLDRLRVDSVDLLQLHSLAHPGEWEIAMGAGGALEAVIEARTEGLTRYIGVTGHGWTIASMHRRSLERFDFDSVLLPWNFVMSESERYREDFEAVCALCEERDVAVQTIKSVARGPWATTAARTATPGISRWRIRTTSSKPSTGCWRGRGSSSTRSAISTCCRWCSMRRVGSNRLRATTQCAWSWRRDARRRCSGLVPDRSAGPRQFPVEDGARFT